MLNSITIRYAFLFYYAENRGIYAADKSEENNSLRKMLQLSPPSTCVTKLYREVISLPPAVALSELWRAQQAGRVQRSLVRSWKARISEVGFLIQRIPLRNYSFKAVVTSFLCAFSNGYEQSAAKRIAIPMALSRIKNIQDYEIFEINEGLNLYERSKALALIRRINGRKLINYSNCPWPNCDFKNHPGNIATHIDNVHLRKTFIFSNGVIKATKNKKCECDFRVVYFIEKEFFLNNKEVYNFFKQIKNNFTAEDVIRTFPGILQSPPRKQLVDTSCKDKLASAPNTENENLVNESLQEALNEVILPL